MCILRTHISAAICTLSIASSVFQLGIFLRVLRPARIVLRPARFTQHPARILKKFIFF